LERFVLNQALDAEENKMLRLGSQVIRRPSRRQPAALNSELENHLSAYTSADYGAASTASCGLATALAMSAVGMGTLFLPEEAHARIIYTPTLKRVEPFPCHVNPLFCRGTVDIDFNNDGVPEIALTNFASGISSVFYARLHAVGQGSNRVLETTAKGCGGSAAVLNLGQEIGPSGQFLTRGLMSGLSMRSQGTTYMCGQWPNKTGKFLGFKLTIDGETHYGWARITERAGSAYGSYIGATLTGYAYETVPDVPIAAGAEGGAISELDAEPTDNVKARANPSSVTNPHLATLGALACRSSFGGSGGPNAAPGHVMRG
jgi:hypothetical protein